MIRNDYLEQVGLNHKEIKTWDDWMNALTLIKTEIDRVEYPWPLTSAVDVIGYYCTSPSFDTLGVVGGRPAMYIKDGQIKFGNMNDNDLSYMQKMNEFYNAGIIDPNWASYTNSFAFSNKTSAGETALMDMAATEVRAYNLGNAVEGCDWQPITKPLLYEGQVLHVGGDVSRVSVGNTQISAKCENIELAVTWCDFRYSEFGSFYINYGPEGVLWEYNDNNEIRLTEWTLTHPAGASWILKLYGLNNISEHGLEDVSRDLKYDGGELIGDMIAYWNDYDYDAAYEVPVGLRLTDDESNYVTALFVDIQTYMAENYSQFLDNGKPFSEWDSYVEGVYALGMQDIIDTYQVAYERYLSQNS